MATQEQATELLGRARRLFQGAMDNGGRLDAAGEFTQWLDDYAAAFETAPSGGE
jgi:hypothetical protein